MNDQQREEDRAASGPVAKSELARLRQQDRPAPSLECNLGDAPQTRRVDQLRARWQAAYIEDRLRGVDGKADRDFTKARLTGRAKQDFERSR